MEALMQVANLQLNTPNRLLLKNLNWEIKTGECWCVIGRNGAGKSTLLRTLAGQRLIENPEENSERAVLKIQGKDSALWSLSDLAKQRAFLPQGRTDAFGYRAIETVLSARHPYHDAHYWESQADIDIATAALHELDVADLAQRDVRSLSGGERQRVAIAALLAQDAQLMLLDEPANALDLAHQVSVMQLFARLCRDCAKAVVMVSHDLNLAHRIASHALLMMGDGSWLVGTTEQVMTAEKLSLCLGHPIERFTHGEQTIFLPKN